MKLALLFAILSISTFNAVNAAEEVDYNITDYASYCDQQAQLAGIEDAAEKSEYIRECVQSYAIPTDEELPQDKG